MGFTADLTFGKKYQEIAKKYVGEEITESPEGLFKAYDFKTETAKYEVKADRLAHRYGCRTMFIEYECIINFIIWCIYFHKCVVF